MRHADLAIGTQDVEAANASRLTEQMPQIRCARRKAIAHLLEVEAAERRPGAGGRPRNIPALRHQLRLVGCVAMSTIDHL